MLSLPPIQLPPMTYGIPHATVLHRFDHPGGVAGVVVANPVTPRFVDPTWLVTRMKEPA